jgi:diacylglycerol kinase (ATP)
VGHFTLPQLALLIKRVLVIANPASRRGRRVAGRVFDTLKREGVESDLVLTQRSGHAAELARERAAGYDAVFVVGGDGTAMEVAGALSGTGTPIGIIPGGTGNLLARALGLPFRVRRLVPELLRGDRFHVDLGRFLGGSERRFAIAAGAGIDASMVAETPSWLKRRLGVLAYTIIAARAVFRTLIKRDWFQVRLTVDGTVHECTAAAVMIANFGAVLGDRIVLGPGIRSDDGVLDAVIFAPRNFRDAFRIMWRLTRKRFVSDGTTLYHSGHHIRIETSPARLFQADGELLGHTPVEVEVEPHAALLLVPRHA